jgi:PPOX class probable F420-dependent enzyme
MTPAIPASHRDLLERPIIAILATVTPKGKPHAVPIWRKFDGEHILMAVDHGSQKHKNIAANPSVSVLTFDPETLYRHIIANGIAEVVETGALDLLDELAHFYLGHPSYFGYSEPVENKAKYRGVILKITSERYSTFG